jgi:hypothetical protein
MMFSRMMFCGEQQVEFISPDMIRLSLYDKLKQWIERISGMPIVWWPLNPPNRNLPPKYTRIIWHLVGPK